MVRCALERDFPLPDTPPLHQEPYCTVWRENGRESRLLRYCKHGSPWPYCMWSREGREIFMRWKPEFRGKLSARQILDALDLFHLLLESGGLVLHASYIQYNGRAILFSGASGVGKSTQAALWEACRGAEVINGDRVLIAAGPDGRFWAHGICYSGTSGICKNSSAPLSALVLLEQSPDNRISRLGGLAALKGLLPQVSYRIWDPEDVANATDLLSRLLSAVPVFRLECRPDEGAVEALERYL